MLKPKLIYFFYYAAMASLLPFLVLYYAQLELSGRQIGVLSALLPVMTLLGVPLWSAVADSSGRYRSLFLLTVGGSLVLTLVTASVTTYAGLLLSVGALTFFVAPVMPLADHSVLTLLQGQKCRYGSLRLWGAVGWGVAAPLAGSLVEDGVRWAFVLAALLLGLLWGVVLRLPATEGRPQRGTGGVGRFVTPVWLGFLLIAFVGGVCLAVSGTFLYLHMADLGVRAPLIGLALTMATLSELPIFFFSGRLMRRYTLPTLLTVSLAVFAVRLLLYGLVFSPWLILTVQGLHGASFSLLWVAGVAYADDLAPEGLSASAQGLFATVVMGWGGVVGALVGGVLYEGVGAAAMFRWTAAGTFACLVPLLWTLYQRRTRPQKELL